MDPAYKFPSLTVIRELVGRGGGVGGGTSPLYARNTLTLETEALFGCEVRTVLEPVSLALKQLGRMIERMDEAITEL